MKTKYSRIHFESVESTNDFVKSQLDTLSDHTLITTDFQSKGRGQRERTWASDPGLNFLGSFYKRSSLKRHHTPMIQGVLTIVFLLDSIGVEAEIKPPNDVYVEGRKIAGILSEVIHNKEKHVIIGIGFNVNEKKVMPAIALSNITGHDYDLESVTNDIMRTMEYVETLDFPTLFNRYVSHIPFGKIVAFNDSDFLGPLESIDQAFQCSAGEDKFPCEALRFQYK